MSDRENFYIYMSLKFTGPFYILSEKFRKNNTMFFLAGVEIFSVEFVFYVQANIVCVLNITVTRLIIN
jgi:hypothetical protein